MAKPPIFRLLATDAASHARLGELTTAHGVVPTPIFMPVGTQGTVKGVTPAMLHDIGTRILLGNTYHLHVRPGSELVATLGGLHGFMGWSGPILTDSGGFQAFSLSALRKVTEEGVHFKSHLDGRPLFLGPREVMTIQRNLNSDIAMVIDECPPWPCERAVAETAIARTTRWAEACRAVLQETGEWEGPRHAFAIAQGGVWADLRQRSAESLAQLDFPGYAIGGVSVGEPEPEMLQQVAATAPSLPWTKPRYVMGVGTPTQLLKMIALGADMFDCVMPTRAARHGTAYTPDGPINLKNARFRDDPRPLVEGLDNYTCRTFSRAYLRHLVVAGELLGATLLTLHNLHFYLDLMAQARLALAEARFSAWSRAWIVRYEAAGTAESEALPPLDERA